MQFKFLPHPVLLHPATSHTGLLIPLPFTMTPPLAHHTLSPFHRSLHPSHSAPPHYAPLPFVSPLLTPPLEDASLDWETNGVGMLVLVVLDTIHLFFCY